jgi:crotonyl-CoA carboxylase/reductase
VATDPHDIVHIPPVGDVPARMPAQVIRPDRFGKPTDAFRVEVVDVPEIGPDDALVLVMAAGINYNNVWAARGVPVDVCQIHGKLGEPADFHIGGSDASGVVYAVGERVTGVEVGDHVVIHCGQWGGEADELGDPTLHPSFRIWGYESNWGSFAQFTKVQAH